MTWEVEALLVHVASLPDVCPGCGEAKRLRYHEDGDDCCVSCRWCGLPFVFWSVDWFTPDEWQDVFRVVGLLDQSAIVI